MLPCALNSSQTPSWQQVSLPPYDGWRYTSKGREFYLLFWLKQGNKALVTSESQEESKKGKDFGDEKEEEIDGWRLEVMAKFCKGGEEEKCLSFLILGFYRYWI